MNENFPVAAGAQSPMPQPQILTLEGKGIEARKIEMDLLRKSIRRESGLAGIRSIPVQFWTLYEAVVSMLERNDLNFTEKAVYVQYNSSKAYLTDEDKAQGYTQKNAPISKWRFDKIITEVQLPNLAEGVNTEEARNAAVAITLNRNGLVVGFGMNVHICTNFNILGGSLIRSYGSRSRSSMPWEVLHVVLSKWIENIHQIWSVQNEIMNAFKGYAIPQDIPIVEEVIGDLYTKAIRQAYFSGDTVPFDTHELSSFVQEVIKQQNKYDRIANLWDLYNWGTSIMKPGSVDIGELAENSNLWADYLMDRFEVAQDLKFDNFEILEETV